MWRLANRDPHLIRLGDYLHHLEGKQEVARLLEEEDIGFEELERAFLAEPWKEGLSIVRVVDLAGSTTSCDDTDTLEIEYEGLPVTMSFRSALDNTTEEEEVVEEEEEQGCCAGKLQDGDQDMFGSLLHIADHCLYRIVRWARNLPDFANVSVSSCTF